MVCVVPLTPERASVFEVGSPGLAHGRGLGAVGGMRGIDIGRARATEDRMEEVKRLLELICDLSDGEECEFDHHGGCQAHGYLSLKPGERCPMGEANEIAAGRGEG